MSRHFSYALSHSGVIKSRRVLTHELKYKQRVIRKMTCRFVAVNGTFQISIKYQFEPNLMSQVNEACKAVCSFFNCHSQSRLVSLHRSTHRWRRSAVARLNYRQLVGVRATHDCQITWKDATKQRELIVIRSKSVGCWLVSLRNLEICHNIIQITNVKPFNIFYRHRHFGEDNFALKLELKAIKLVFEQHKNTFSPI